VNRADMHTHLNGVRGVQKVSSLTKLPCRRPSLRSIPRAFIIASLCRQCHRVKLPHIPRAADALGSVRRSPCRESRRCRSRIFERFSRLNRFVLKELRRTAPAGPKLSNAQRRRAPTIRNRSKTPARPATRTNSQSGGLTRVEMIAAVLKRHPRRTVRELIALLDREYHWKTTESAVTGHLYTRRDKFVHTAPDRAANRPVTWSSK
jgi:hypothetical protein